jgi:hypothetical protein
MAPLQNTDLFVVDRGGTNYKMAASQVTAKTGATGASIIPPGTTAERPTGVPGLLRWNTQLGYLEVYTNAATQWNQLDYLPLPPTLPPDITYSTNATVSGVIVCNNLVLNAGVTLTAINYGVLFICYGNATINGTINANLGGAAGPAGALIQWANVPGFASVDFAFNTPSWTGPGSSGQPYPPVVYLGGSSVRGSYATVSSDSSLTVGGGQPAGGYIAIRAYGSITTTGTSVLSANGGSGTGYIAATGIAWGAGISGSSGGTIILHANSNITTAGTISATGGNGGPPGSSNLPPGIGLGGGNGGSGGLIVLQTAASLTAGHTAQLAGGIGGAGISTPMTYGAPAGGGNGGSGGVSNPPGSVSTTGNPGSAGITTTSGSPFP